VRNSAPIVLAARQQPQDRNILQPRYSLIAPATRLSVINPAKPNGLTILAQPRGEGHIPARLKVGGSLMPGRGDRPPSPRWAEPSCMMSSVNQTARLVTRGVTLHDHAGSAGN